ncbi:MAG: hypothetical protein H6839_02080 [Planctomycetes bacterium]|nr:hypothetical protein [Planctomycetota bacterium]
MTYECPILATPQNRRTTMALLAIVVLQGVGLLPGLLGWRPISIRGVDKEVLILAPVMLATVLGALFGTLVLNWRYRAATGERCFLVVASLFTLPGIVGLVVALGGVLTWEFEAVAWAPVWIVSLGVPIALSMPFAFLASWATQRIIDRKRAQQ